MTTEPERLHSALLAIFCGVPVDNGTALCPEICGACPIHSTDSEGTPTCVTD